MNKFAILSVVAAVAAIAFLTMAPQVDSQLEAEFGSFLANYGRSYNSQAEYDFRMNVFKKNLQRAAEQQKKSKTATFGVTQFSDWTDEEFRRLLGDRDELDAGQCVYSEKEATNGARKPVDLKNLFQPVQNQASCGSCWSFAATATFEAYWKKVKGESVKGSEQFLVDCDNKLDSGCNGGLSNNAYYFLSDKSNAFVTEEAYPYEAKDLTCRASGKKTIGNTAGCHAVKKSEDAMYAQLSQGADSGPISISVDASVWHSYTGGILAGADCGLQTNHAVVIVGYGTDAELNTDYWVVRNSWGPDYGESGYIRLAADQNTCNLTKRPGFPDIE